MTDMAAMQPTKVKRMPRLSTAWLPFADAASPDLPLSRLLRLSLFQVSVGMAMALTVGTLNRVLLVEFGVAASLIALMVALPIAVAPFRALIGFRSDTYRSALGWRRVPFIWYGTLLQFGGLAIMPFALLVLSGSGEATAGYEILSGQIAGALAFLLIGAGVQATQTAGLALATDIAPEESRPRVVALMYVMLLVGMAVASAAFGVLLIDFTPILLIQVIQGAAALTAVLNLIALWKQEPRNPSRKPGKGEPQPSFAEAWRGFTQSGRAKRFLVAVGLGTAAFSMQDILLEPYGGEILGLAVSQTTILTAIYGVGALLAFAAAARGLTRGHNPFRLGAYGALVGIPGFSAVIVSAPFGSPWLFWIGAFIIGVGAGLFAVATLTAAMGFVRQGHSGMALGAWGAVQATTAGIAIALGGVIRDVIDTVGASGVLGPAMMETTTGYHVVYHLEILLLFVTMVAIGPLARHSADRQPKASAKFGLADLPT